MNGKDFIVDMMAALREMQKHEGTMRGAVARTKFNKMNAQLARAQMTAYSNQILH